MVIDAVTFFLKAHNLTQLPVYFWGASSGGTLALKLVGTLHRQRQEAAREAAARGLPPPWALMSWGIISGGWVVAGWVARCLVLLGGLQVAGSCGAAAGNGGSGHRPLAVATHASPCPHLTTTLLPLPPPPSRGGHPHRL